MSDPSPSDLPRCGWAAGGPAMLAYHDRDWGTPERDDRALFENLSLQGTQAGLSWRLVLERRQNYRRAFHGFDIVRVAAMTDAEIEALLADAGLIRNRAKLNAVRSNARATLAVIESEGGFGRYLWSFVGGEPLVNRWTAHAEMPATSEISDRMSRDMKRRGFVFVGSTVCYSLMQSAGLVNDHMVGCFRHPAFGRRVQE
ncbi:DNA-3-methyladenine glycosylase I [Inquilinus sp. OTU3971]|uniref:DNA-3-methyladenine glycosylase I n=1 Tax=Inquilinus sp. OTU3971 TaxID=3043855 RepID=UPI00313D5005